MPGGVQTVPEPADRRDLEAERLDALAHSRDVHANLARLAFTVPQAFEQLLLGHAAVERRSEDLRQPLVDRREEHALARVGELAEAVDCRLCRVVQRSGCKGGEPGSHVAVVGREADPVGETAGQVRRRDTRLDQQQVRTVEPSQSLRVGALLRPPHHDHVVVRCRSEHVVGVCHNTVSLYRFVSVSVS